MPPFERYRASLPEHLRVLLDHFELKDYALKVVGVGSVGTRCGVLLLMSGDRDPLFLQVKEARRSVLEPYAGRSLHPNHGQRVVHGQKLMQAASDLLLGWTTGTVKHRHFYIRQLRDMKLKPLVETMDVETLEFYAELCGRILARAHAKSGYPATISGYLGRSEAFDDAIGKFALAYARQNERDYRELLRAIRSGRIEALPEGV